MLIVGFAFDNLFVEFHKIFLVGLADECQTRDTRNIPSHRERHFNDVVFSTAFDFASPNFSQTHSKLFFFNLLFPLAIIALAIPADWIGNKVFSKKRLPPRFQCVISSICRRLPAS